MRVYGKDEDDSLDSEAGENERTKARIIVDSFETDPAEIYAGQDFTLKVRMKNASNSIAASNILFTFESEAVSDSPGIYDGERFKLRGCQFSGTGSI